MKIHKIRFSDSGKVVGGYITLHCCFEVFLTSNSGISSRDFLQIIGVHEGTHCQFASLFVTCSHLIKASLHNAMCPLSNRMLL